MILRAVRRRPGQERLLARNGARPGKGPGHLERKRTEPCLAAGVVGEGNGEAEVGEEQQRGRADADDDQPREPRAKGRDGGGSFVR